MAHRAALLFGFAIVAVAVVLLLADTTGRQLTRTAALVTPLAVLGYGLVSAPDLVERLVLVGS